MGELVPAVVKVRELEKMLVKEQDRFMALLPKFLEAEKGRLFAVAMKALRDPKIAGCTAPSVIDAIIQSSELGIPIDNVHGALVPYKNNKSNHVEATFIAMYRGLIKSVRRGGEIRQFWAECVYEGEHFKQTGGTHRSLSHVPRYDIKRNQSTMKGAYACARWKDGTVDFDYMPIEEILRLKERARSKSGPWSTDFAEMAKKSPMRRLCKKLPLTTELQSWLDADEARELEIDKDAPLDVEHEDVNWRPGKLSTDDVDEKQEEEQAGSSRDEKQPGEPTGEPKKDAPKEGAPTVTWHKGIEIVDVEKRNLEKDCGTKIVSPGKATDGMTILDALRSEVPAVKAAWAECLEVAKAQQEANGASSWFFQAVAHVDRAHAPKSA